MKSVKKLKKWEVVGSLKQGHYVDVFTIYYLTGSVVLIDMEYSDVNYAAFDVGAFFCEFSGKKL